MNKTVELINEWASFSETHPNSSIEDFCRFFLIFRSAKEVDPQRNEAVVLPDERIFLIQLIEQIVGAYTIYNKIALSQTDVPFPDGFFYLMALRHLSETKKTDLINSLLAEYTTGMEAINKLIKLGLITERVDPSDRRAKLIKLTEEGRRILLDSSKESRKVPYFLFSDLTTEEIKLCLQLLTPIAEKHAQFAVELKGGGNMEFFKNLEFEDL